MYAAIPYYGYDYPYYSSYYYGYRPYYGYGYGYGARITAPIGAMAGVLRAA